MCFIRTEKLLQLVSNPTEIFTVRSFKVLSISEIASKNVAYGGGRAGVDDADNSSGDECMDAEETILSDCGPSNAIIPINAHSLCPGVCAYFPIRQVTRKGKRPIRGDIY